MGSIKYTLKVVSGDFTGHVYPLPENSELTLGRSPHCDIMIESDVVSGRHVKLITFPHQILLEDLKSTNGTLVNNESVRGTRAIQLGDRIAIGSYTFEVMPATAGAPQPPLGPEQSTTPNPAHAAPPSYAAPTPLATPPAANPPRITNNYNNRTINAVTGPKKPKFGPFPSPEVSDVLSLLKELVTGQHNGVLAVHDPEDREGRIYIRGGHIYFASYDDPYHAIDIPPEQALVRVCTWPQGRYRVQTSAALPAFGQEVTQDSQSLLEYVRQTCQELKQLRAQLPPANARVSICVPLNPPLASLSADQLYLFQLVINSHDVGSLINHYPRGEIEGMKALLGLLEATLFDHLMRSELT